MLREKIKKLAFDLHTIKWWGADEGWDLACEKIRKEIVLILEDIPQESNTETCNNCKLLNASTGCKVYLAAFTWVSVTKSEFGCNKFEEKIKSINE